MDSREHARGKVQGTSQGWWPQIRSFVAEIEEISRRPCWRWYRQETLMLPWSLDQTLMSLILVVGLFIQCSTTEDTDSNLHNGVHGTDFWSCRDLRLYP